jgi:hypothetical protein
MLLCERPRLTEVATLDHRHFAVVRPSHTDAFTLLPFWFVSRACLGLMVGRASYPR